MWTTIENGSYTIDTTNKGNFRKVVHRLIHMSILFSINQKKEGDQMPLLGVFFMLCIITPNVFFHLPYCVADFFDESGRQEQGWVPIYGGMIVTKLVGSFWILDEPKATFLTRMGVCPLQTRLFKTACIMGDMGNNTYSVLIDDVVEFSAEHKNVRSRVEDQEPRDATMGDELPLDPYHVIAGNMMMTLVRV